jgi:hypothetical protein
MQFCKGCGCECDKRVAWKITFSGENAVAWIKGPYMCRDCAQGYDIHATNATPERIAEVKRLAAIAGCGEPVDECRVLRKGLD